MNRRPPSPRSRSPPPRRRPTSRQRHRAHAKSSTTRRLRGRFGGRCSTPMPSPAPTASARSSGRRGRSTRSTSGSPRPPPPSRHSRRSTTPTAPSPRWPSVSTRPPPPASPFSRHASRRSEPRGGDYPSRGHPSASSRSARTDSLVGPEEGYGRWTSKAGALSSNRRHPTTRLRVRSSARSSPNGRPSSGGRIERCFTASPPASTRTRRASSRRYSASITKGCNATSARPVTPSRMTRGPTGSGSPVARSACRTYRCGWSRATSLSSSNGSGRATARSSAQSSTASQPTTRPRTTRSAATTPCRAKSGSARFSQRSVASREPSRCSGRGSPQRRPSRSHTRSSRAASPTSKSSSGPSTCRTRTESLRSRGWNDGCKASSGRTAVGPTTAPSSARHRWSNSFPESHSSSRPSHASRSTSGARPAR